MIMKAQVIAQNFYGLPFHLFRGMHTLHGTPLNFESTMSKASAVDDFNLLKVLTVFYACS